MTSATQNQSAFLDNAHELTAAEIVVMMGCPAAARHQEIAHYARKHGKELRRYFHRHGISRDLVEDMVQDTFLRLLEARTEFNDIKAYGKTIAVNMVRSHILTERIHAGILPTILLLYGETIDPLDPFAHISGQDLLQKVYRYMERWTAAEQYIFIARRVDRTEWNTVTCHAETSLSKATRSFRQTSRDLSENFKDAIS